MEGSADVDLLHHAILAGHDELVCWLLAAGYSPLAPPGGVPYLVLACALGRSGVIAKLLELQPMSLTTRLSTRACAVLLDVVPSGVARALALCGKQAVTALDAAAAAGSLACVQAVLSRRRAARGASGEPARPDDGQLEWAVRLDSFPALCLLFTQPALPAAVTRAVKEALRVKSADCLALLLAHCTDDALDDVDVYHSLYIHVGGRTDSLARCTALLLEQGCDVNARRRPGAFPLHSLLYSLVQEKDYRPACPPHNHMATLVALLAAGADPNHDEVADAAARFCTPRTGRDLYVSALHALLVPLQSCDSWRPHVQACVLACVRELLSHGADAESRAAVLTSETPLHQLMKALAMQHAMGHVCADLSDTRSLLLRHGACPDHPHDPATPAVHYFRVLCERMGGRIAFERWRRSGAVPAVVRMLVTMSRSAANQAVRHIRAVLDDARPDGVTDEIVRYVNSEMASICQDVRLLTQLAGLAVWRAAGRRQCNLQAVHMPNLLRTHILNMLD